MLPLPNHNIRNYERVVVSYERWFPTKDLNHNGYYVGITCEWLWVDLIDFKI